jgi:hypothetical protein
MKKNVPNFLLVILVLMSTLNACKNLETPDKVASKFLDHISKKEFSEAKKLATSESATMIDMQESFSKMGGVATKEAKIKNMMCKEEGEKATCDYTKDGEAEKLDLIKKDGKWLVDMKKESPDMDESSTNVSNNNDNSIETEEQSDNTEIHSSSQDEEKKDCSNLHSDADDAYSYCKKAYNSDDFDEIKTYLKKAMSSFDDAMIHANDCDCSEAYSAASDGYNYAKKGYNSDDFDEMKMYAKKAKNQAENTMSYADDCTH